MVKVRGWRALGVIVLAVVISLYSSSVWAGAFEWTVPAGVEGGVVKSLAYDGTYYYAGTYGGGVAYSSSLGSWSLPTTPPGNSFVNAVNILDIGLGYPVPFACTEGGVFYSPDFLFMGDHWYSLTSLGAGHSRTTGIVYDGITTGDYFVSTNGSGVFRGHWNGADYEWTQENTGLLGNGLYANAIVLVSGKLYLATNNGIYSSTVVTTPSTQSWTSDSAGLTNNSVLSLINNGANLYAGTNGGGFYWAATGGALSWTQANGTGANLLGGMSVRNLSFSGGFLFAATNLGNFYTNDTGANWTNNNGPVLTDTGTSDTNLFAVLFDGSEVLVGNSYGVFLSSSPLLWTSLNNGLSSASVSAFAINPKNPSIVYMATSGGVYKSTDWGSTWTPKLNGLVDKNVTALAISDTNPNILYAGTFSGFIYYSGDGADSWQQFKFLSSPINDIKFKPKESNINAWFGSASLYQYAMINGVMTWKKIQSPYLFGTTVVSIAFNPVNTNIMYVGTSTTPTCVAKSTDGGNTWNYAAAPRTWSARQVLVDPLEPKRIYVITNNSKADTYDGGISISNDSGASWWSNEGMDNKQYRTYNYLAIDPIFNNKVYVTCLAKGEIGTVTFTGSGLNDLTAGGDYVGTSTRNYVVQIDGTGAPDTFRWSQDGGSTWAATGVAITGGEQYLSYGITITFAASTGHTLNDSWSFTAKPPLSPVRYTETFFTYQFIMDDTGLPDKYVGVLAINPAFPNILLAGRYDGPYIYEDVYLPAESVTINKGKDYTNSTLVSLSMTYRPTTQFMRFSNNGIGWSAWLPISSVASWTLSSGNGTKTVYAQFKDKAGFTTSAQDDIILDTVKPTFGSISIVGGAVTTGAAQTISLSAADNAAGTGIKEFRLSNSTTFGSDINNPVYSVWFPYSGAVTVPWNLKRGGGLIVGGIGGLKVYVQFRDYAGNILQKASAATSNDVAASTSLNAVADLIVTNRVHLSWSDNADNELSYVIERRKVPNLTFTAVKTLPSPNIGTVNNSYDDDVLGGPGTYEYRIKVMGNGFNHIYPTVGPYPSVIIP